MVIGVAFLIVAILIASVWIIIEIKRLKHKLFAIFLVILIISGYLSIMVTFKGQEVDLKTIPGVIGAGKMYLSWLGSAFGNMKSITTYAVQKEWGSSNETTERKK